MRWIYLSPHLDDVALSLGGLLWEQSAAGDEVEIWTICAGDAPEGDISPFAQSLHDRWGTGAASAAARREEDIASCAHLGAGFRHFDVPDCIYRRSARSGAFLYTSEESLTGALHSNEQGLIQRLRQTLNEARHHGDRFVCPLALGSHVDHQLTRAAAEALQIPLLYYADYPYIRGMEGWQPADMLARAFPVSAKGIAAWQHAIAAHSSQISTFWESIPAMEADIQAFARQMGGARLWAPT